MTMLAEIGVGADVVVGVVVVVVVVVAVGRDRRCAWADVAVKEITASELSATTDAMRSW